jgi:hypothetical protein
MIGDQFVSATAPSAHEALQQLDRQLNDYYNRQGISDYYCLAHKVNKTWLPHSYHTLVERMTTSGTKVLDSRCQKAVTRDFARSLFIRCGCCIKRDYA